MSEHDVIIVGAGPAGSIAAETCAKEGLNVVLVEKMPYSGYKLCGGGLPSPILKEFKIDKDLIECNINWSYLFGKKNNIMKEIKGDVSVDRSKFDRYLAKRAVTSGANILTLTTSKEVVREEDGNISGIIAKSQKGFKKIYGKIIIAADGFYSPTARSARLLKKYERTDFALTVQVEVYTQRELDEEISYSFYDENIALCGYGWIIPKKYGYSVGVGCLSSHIKGKLENNLKYMMEKHEVASNIISNKKIVKMSELRAACIPLNPSPEICDSGIMVVGDAAGHVHPLGGHGIYYAMKAGQLAGRIAIKAISNEDTTKENLMEYQDTWEKTYGKMIKQKQKILYKKKDDFIRYSNQMIFFEKYPILKKINSVRERLI